MTLTRGDRAALNRHVAEILRILGARFQTGQLRLNLNDSDVQSFDVKMHSRVYAKDVDSFDEIRQH